MNEEMLRAVIREAVERRLGRSPESSGPPASPALFRPASQTLFSIDASHERYSLPPSGGPCLIEPAVQCNHCGYCESHGH